MSKTTKGDNVSLAGIKLRAQIAQLIREWLLAHDFEEYIPQLMSEAQPLEPTIYPFSTSWNRQKGDSSKSMSQYFATSPEGYLKQVMASGSNHCFAISHAFRNLEGEGPLHRPEFLMVEWYLQNADWHHMMSQTQQLILFVWEKSCTHLTLPSNQPWDTISFRDLWQKYLHVDLDTLLTDSKMSAFAAQKGYHTKGATWEQLFYQAVFNEIEPHFEAKPFFLIDFPCRISPLAKPQSSTPYYSERFELIMNKVELANGNTENTNINTIKAMMEKEQQLRAKADHAPPIDNKFLTSLSTLKKYQWAGVGLGIDRLTMMIGKRLSIKHVQWI